MTSECEMCGWEDCTCKNKSKLKKFKDSGLIGSLNGTGVTSENYKESALAALMVKNIKDIGVVKQKIRHLMTEDIFDSRRLSKHNPYWKSESEKEDEKLWQLRGNLMYIQDALSKVLDILDD